ncbi:hypothetical protein [uncultured Deefgea sp.]|uniref:hypothetical protein n=1 Tax=uncultured Deefgea sp. TaxID=1304914 RepID=UPI0025958D88|nr:hypothetical protein [uncultured Deefgea sp.]
MHLRSMWSMCGQGLLKVGEDISEQLHVQPAVLAHRRLHRGRFVWATIEEK